LRAERSNPSHHVKEEWIASSASLLAMTVDGYDFAISRREAPEVLHFVVPPRIQGAGTAGCAPHPRSRVQLAQRKRTRAYRFGGGIRLSLRNGFTAYFVLAPVTGLLATVITRIAPHNLTPAPGRQAHTTSPYATARSSFAAAASTATRPNVCDDGQRPSDGTGCGSSRTDLGESKSGIFSLAGLDQAHA
jgi:hypothetical protein